MIKVGPLQRKILILLAGTAGMSMSTSPRQYYKMLHMMSKEWGGTRQYSFTRSIKSLSREKLLEEKKFPNGTIKLVLTKEGEFQAKKLKLLGNSINFKKPKKWDGKWRLVIFDIPERDRLFRSILREHLQKLDFLKLQNSVFVSPYPFEKMILELSHLYSAEKYVRVITATTIDNEEKLKKRFFSKN